MNISYTWLKDYIPIRLSADETRRRLIFAGLEVGPLGVTPAGDQVFEIEITANRPDWLSLQGVARELSALTGIPRTPVASLTEPEGRSPAPFSIQIDDRHGCPRYTGRLLRDVRIGTSPEWMAQRLASIGSRLINNAADITNFCLFECGQPLHVFDYDTLKGGNIIVRRAKDKEKLTLIDGSTRELDPSILVIADAERAVAIAGIMGGKETEVTERTKTILLESAFFDPVVIRRASRKLGLRTDASYRFERRVDPHLALAASRRAAWLFQEICGADSSVACVDVNHSLPERRIIPVLPDRINALIGVTISTEEVTRILRSLEFEVAQNERGLSVTVPSFRYDVRHPEDIAEEVARLHGYENIPECLPALNAQVSAAYSPLYQAKQSLREALAAIGLDEVITYTLVSEAMLKACGGAGNDILRLRNPLSAEQACLRTVMSGSLLSVVRTNHNRQNTDIKIFEIGKTYHAEKAGCRERENVAVALSGNRYANWQEHLRRVDLYDIRGIMEYILDHFSISPLAFITAEYPWYQPDQSLQIRCADMVLGHGGRIRETVAKYFDISLPVFACELDLAALTQLRKQNFPYEPLSRFPSIIRDIAAVVPETTAAGRAEEIIRDIAGELCVRVQLFDVYRGDPVPSGHKSLAFSVEYQSRTSTLTEEQITGVHARILAALSGKLGATIR